MLLSGNYPTGGPSRGPPRGKTTARFATVGTINFGTDRPYLMPKIEDALALPFCERQNEG